MKLLKRKEKKEIMKKLNEQFGIKNIDGILLRFGKEKINSDMSSKEIEKHIKLSNEVKDFLNESAENLKLSARVYHKVIKLARTIADLDNSKEITNKHLLEALSYRPKENSL